MLSDNTGRMDYAVIFHPDPAKGNTNPWKCEGWLSSQPRTAGRYELWTLAFQTPRAFRGVNGTQLARHAVAPLHLAMWEGHDSGSRKGAPLGWYKVTLRAAEAVPEADVARIRKYLKLDSTPLIIEVVENPEQGHYDIKLEK
jgi:hypothetical protein